MNDSAFIQNFIHYLKFEKHFSAQTAKCYEADLVQYCDFLNAQTQSDYDTPNPWDPDHAVVATQAQAQSQTDLDARLLAADATTIRRFIAELNARSYARSTMARKLATVRSFYKFLVRRNRVSSNPAANIKTPKQEKKLPKFLEYDQVQRLLNTPPGAYMARVPGSRYDGSAVQHGNAGQ